MKTLKDLTVEEVDRELLRLMEEQPDFVYQEASKAGKYCYYNRGPWDEPDKCDGCIFGQAFQRLGVPKKLLNSLQGILTFWSEENNNKSYAPVYWAEIQRDQDGGSPWGELKKYLPKEVLDLAG